MKHFTAICLLTCASFSAFAQEQQQPAPPATPEQQPVQQLDTTTIQTEQAPQPEIAQPARSQHIALRVVGSHVLGQTGERLGRIEEVLLNRTTGAIEFAVVAPQTPANSPRLVPIPWGSLTHTWDQSRTGGPAGANQVFSANLDSRRLAQAPSFDRSRIVGMDQVLANAGTFFGQPQATGAASAAGGNVSGVGAATPPQTGTIPTPAPGTPVGPGNNPLVVPGQQASGFPGVSQPGNRLPPPQQRVPHAGANTPGVGGQPQLNGNAQQQPQNNGTAAGASGQTGSAAGQSGARSSSSGGQATGSSSSGGGATGGSSGSSGGSSSGGSSGGGATGK